MNEPEPLPDDLRRFCIKCGREIDAKRVLRGSVTCGASCYQADRKARRAYRASKACRLCGRPPKVRKAEKDAPDQRAPRAQVVSPTNHNCELAATGKEFH